MTKIKNNFASPFLENRERLLTNEIGFVIYDKYPVSKGHCLVIPHRVYSDYFESTWDEILGLQKLILNAKKILEIEYRPDGFNIGVNSGVSAGQTVPHVHIHVIPRYSGDMDDPTGGVRGVIPAKQKY